jgi:hypothetical protein
VPDQLLTWTLGRPPANAREVPMTSVRAPSWLDAKLNLTVTGPIALKTAIGNPLILLPTVKVIGPHDFMRESDGLRG